MCNARRHAWQEASAEAKYLNGLGIARERKAIVDGLRDSVEEFSESVEGASAKGGWARTEGGGGMTNNVHGGAPLNGHQSHVSLVLTTISVCVCGCRQRCSTC